MVKLTYLSHLLLSDDPDDKEHACLAIAAIAQGSPDNRKSLFEHKISGQVLGVLKETCQQAMPRQRLQRVAVMALSELAQDFDAFQQLRWPLLRWSPDGLGQRVHRGLQHHVRRRDTLCGDKSQHTGLFNQSNTWVGLTLIFNFNIPQCYMHDQA